MIFKVFELYEEDIVKILSSVSNCKTFRLAIPLELKNINSEGNFPDGSPNYNIEIDSNSISNLEKILDRKISYYSTIK